jgi:hypothetical protein
MPQVNDYVYFVDERTAKPREGLVVKVGVSKLGYDYVVIWEDFAPVQQPKYRTFWRLYMGSVIVH